MTNNKSKGAPIEPFVRRHRPFFVTLFVLIPILTVPILLYFTFIKSDAFHAWHTLHVTYESSQGLKQGSQVSMSGIPIGHVKSVNLVKEKVIQVEFNINDRYIHLVKKDSRARMKQRGFMGDWEIEIYGGSAGAEVAESGDTLHPERLTSIDEIMEAAIVVFDTAVILLSDVAALVKGMEDGEGTVGQLLKNDTLFRYINQIGAQTVQITATAQVMMDQVQKLINSDVRGTIRNADSLLSTLTNVTTTVGNSGLALVDSLNNLLVTVNRSFEDIDVILKDLKSVTGEAPELVDRLKDDLEEVELLLQSLQKNWFLRKAIGGGGPKNPSLTDVP